jgi:hypothetical protein
VVEVIRVYAVEALSLGLKRREREGNHLSPWSAEVELYLHSTIRSHVVYKDILRSKIKLVYWNIVSFSGKWSLKFLLCSNRRVSTRWFKYDRDDLCVNKSQFVPVIFESPCIICLSHVR